MLYLVNLGDTLVIEVRLVDYFEIDHARKDHRKYNGSTNYPLLRLSALVVQTILVPVVV